MNTVQGLRENWVSGRLGLNVTDSRNTEFYNDNDKCLQNFHFKYNTNTVSYLHHQNMPNKYYKQFSVAHIS